MSMTEYSPKIAKALHAVMGKCGYVQKKQTNKFHNYKYAGEADLLEVLRPAMLDQGLMLVPSCVDRSPVDEYGNTHVTMEYTLIHKDGDVWPDKIHAFGTGNDKNNKGGVGDKGTYKAITGANKYMLFKLFQIETGDDPETLAEDPDGPTAKQPEQPPAQPKQTPEEWARNVHGGDTVDISKLGPKGEEQQYKAFLVLVKTAPTLHSFNRLKEANDGYLQWLSDKAPEKYESVLDALRAKGAELSQEPASEAA